MLNPITIIMVNKLKQENGSKFTIIKYHINATEFIKLFPIKSFISILSVPWFTIVLFYKGKPFLILNRDIERNWQQKSGMLLW